MQAESRRILLQVAIISPLMMSRLKPRILVLFVGLDAQRVFQALISGQRSFRVNAHFGLRSDRGAPSLCTCSSSGGEPSPGFITANSRTFSCATS